MKKTECVLGIDTSNYTTSVALVDKNGDILSDFRKILKVEKGNRGLRQSEALFQHVVNLPIIIEKLTANKKIAIKAVAASEKPRPVEGSYMPCFHAGITLGKSIASLMDIPYYGFSHQEGHIAALLPKAKLDRIKGFVCFHISGGTCELLKVRKENINIIGGSKDISFGQLIDRTGVAMGMGFPAGEEMDLLAGEGYYTNHLKPIKINNLWINLSGIETGVKVLVEKDVNKKEIASELFEKIGTCIGKMMINALEKTDFEKGLLVGGVSTSKTMRSYIEKIGKGRIIIIKSDLGKDNSVGIAQLGREKL